jgi:hypothetical protein
VSSSPSAGTARGAGAGTLAVLVASVLWGTTGTAATFAPAMKFNQAQKKKKRTSSRYACK